MTSLGEGPTLLQTMAAAVELHRDFQHSQARPASPRMLGKRAVAEAQAGDFRSAAATMRELDKYDPQQLRDPDGKWTSSGSSGSSDHSSPSSDQALGAVADRIVSATSEMEAGARGLCEATDDTSRTRHATTLARAAAAMHRVLAELPADVNLDQVTPSSRGALGEAYQQLQRVRSQLHQCGILKVRIDPDADDDDDDYQRAHQTVVRHLTDERERARALGKSVTLLKREEHPMRSSDLDRLESEADSLIRKISHALGEDDDDDDATVEDNWSEHADAKAKGNNASLDDDDEDDDEPDIWNLHLTKDERYLDRGRGHRNMGPVRINERFPPDPHQLGFVDVVGEGKRHKFDARVDLVAERDGVSRNVAMSRARQEFPESYADYQMWLAEQPTNAQHMRRSGYGVAKRAPTTFEDLVTQEMRKGVNMEIAAQRVMQTHGSAALRSRALGPRSDPARITKRLTQRIDELRADGLTGCEALRKLRLDREYFW
jgi:hypothetical protein